MNLKRLNILHADDDTDDYIFLKATLDELQLPTHHKSVHDGGQLIQYLANEKNVLPHILFLYLNMPRKNGAECFTEIKFSKRLKEVIVVIFSTSLAPELIKTLYKNGVHYYISKHANLTKFKKVIQQTFIELITQKNTPQSNQEHFGLVI